MTMASIQTQRSRGLFWGKGLTEQQQYTREYSVDGMSVRTSVRPPNAGEIFYVSSESDPEREYVVRVRPNFEQRVATSTSTGTYDLTSYQYICSCQDFFFREWALSKTCKHIEVVKALVKLTVSPFVLAAKLRSL